MSVLGIVIVAVILFPLVQQSPTAMASQLQQAAYSIDLRQRLMRACPQHAEVLGTGGILDFTGINYAVRSNGTLPQKRQLGCDGPESRDQRDVCGAKRCLVWDPSVRGQVYAESKCGTNDGMPIGRDGKPSLEISFRTSRCLETPRQVGYEFVGTCMGANVFAPKPIAAKCGLQTSLD